jgi:hypothetical protein
VIVLKHLSREFNIEPYRLRQFLRAKFPHDKVDGKYRTYKWDNANDPELLSIKDALRRLK